MRGSVTKQLILKDWKLQQLPILVMILVGAGAIGIVKLGGEKAFVVGTVFFFIALILSAAMPLNSIGGDRKNHHLAFVMSLPVTSMQYTTSKLLAALGLFAIPWLSLVLAAIFMIELRHMAPPGAIPFLLILALLPVIGFCIITGAVLVGETEGWGIAANVLTSSTYGLTYYFLTQVPALMQNLLAPAPVWNSTALRILSVEVGASILILGITYFLQSRKRDFI